MTDDRRAQILAQVASWSPERRAAARAAALEIRKALLVELLIMDSCEGNEHV